MMAVSDLKYLVNMGEAQEAAEAIEKLKADFPQIAGADFDAFCRAEMLYCEGKYTKANRSYEQFLTDYPDSKLYDAALERQFSIGKAFLEGHKKRVLKVFRMRSYSSGEKIMEKVGDRAGSAPIAARAALSVANNLEKRGKYEEAYMEWSLINTRWPTGQIGRDSLLAMGRCKHAAYNGPKYDVSNLVSAKSYYERFKLRYPEEAEKYDIDRKLAQIEQQAAHKQFEVARFYQESGNPQVARFYYQMVLDDWPESTAAKMAKHNVDNLETGKSAKKKAGFLKNLFGSKEEK
jgi:TolA-binding protein